MAKKKGLNLDLIKQSVAEDTKATDESNPSYKSTPDYVKRRMDLQSNMARGKREKRLTYRIDPVVCMIRDDHDRDYRRLNEENCRELIDGIKIHGQETPAIVRNLDNNDQYQYELVCGARRHWVTSYLKTDFIVEVRDLSEEEVFIVSDEENRNRKDITDYERAVKYKKALKSLYQSQVQMCERMGVSKDWLSRYLDLANMHEDIIEAYEDLSEIKVRHARELKPLMKDPAQRAMMLKIAKSMHANPEKGAVVMSKLKGSIRANAKPDTKHNKTYTAGGNASLLTVKSCTLKKLTIEIDRSNHNSIDDWITALKAAFNDLEKE